MRGWYCNVVLKPSNLISGYNRIVFYVVIKRKIGKAS
jgi:hypothetical protein